MHLISIWWVADLNLESLCGFSQAFGLNGVHDCFPPLIFHYHPTISYSMLYEVHS